MLGFALGGLSGTNAIWTLRVDNLGPNAAQDVAVD